VAAIDTQSAIALPRSLITRLRSMLAGGSGEASVTRRLAGTIFVIRVLSAALAYLSQILLARWMGGPEYGVYVYVWTWVLLFGSMMDFGISASAQKIIPEYRTSGQHALLRGFLTGSRWMTFIVSAVVSLLLAGVVRLLAPWIEANAIVPLYIGCITLPAFVVANTQDGIARSHDWNPRRCLRARLQSRRRRGGDRKRGCGVDRDDLADVRAEPAPCRPYRTRRQTI